MKYTKEELENMIDGLFRYCNIEEELSDKQKIKILKDIKISLEADSDFSYDIASNTLDKKVKEKNLARFNANTLAINEINICIRYLKYKLSKEKQRKREKCLQLIRKIIK